MKNKELLNICYKFINRFITADELVILLQKVDLKELSEDNVKQMNELIDDIKTLVSSIPNKTDKYVIEKKESMKKMINKLEKVYENIDKKDADKIKKHIDSLKEDYNKEIDSHERWFNICKCINENVYFNNCFESLSKYELLEFIAQYIRAPFPPEINQEEFNELVKVGIEHNEKEWLWRLAFNYNNKNIKFDLIVDYFIKIKNGYYLVELISAVGDNLDIDSIIEKVVDKELIDDLKTRKSIMSNYVTEEQFNKLINKKD